jgi:hypothetical protein
LVCFELHPFHLHAANLPALPPRVLPALPAFAIMRPALKTRSLLPLAQPFHPCIATRFKVTGVKAMVDNTAKPVRVVLCLLALPTTSLCKVRARCMGRSRFTCTICCGDVVVLLL